MKREPGIALKDALRFWDSEDGIFDPQEWAARFLADRGLPAAKDRARRLGPVIVLRGRKFQTRYENTRENWLLRVEERYAETSGQHWAARIERLGQPEGERLISHLSALGAAAAALSDERAAAREQRSQAGKVPRGFAATLPARLERAYAHNPKWRTKGFAALSRHVVAQAKANGEGTPEWKSVEREIRRLREEKAD